MKHILFISEFKGYLLGEITAAAWAAALVFAFTGVTISLLMSTGNRDKNKEGSPFYLSIKYLVTDNIQRIVLNVLLILVFLRFAPQLLGTDLTMILALGVGLGFDQLGFILRKKNIIDKS